MASKKPEIDETLRQLIRDTIKSAGELDPAELPHRVRERIAGQIKGELDIDDLIKEALREKRRSD